MKEIHDKIKGFLSTAIDYYEALKENAKTGVERAYYMGVIVGLNSVNMTFFNSFEALDEIKEK